MTKAALGFTASLCALSVALAACGQKPAEAPAASSAPAATATVQPQLTPGVITTVSATDLTINNQDTPASFQLSPATQIMVTHAGTIADIKPGSFIGTTNVPSADGTGQSTEVHVFPPGVKMGEGDRPMGAAPTATTRMTNGTVSAAAPKAGSATRMTNGSVGTVANAAAGLEMDVAYEGGKRHIVVPSDTPVMVMSSGSTQLLKPGVKVLVGAVPAASGNPTATFINIQP